MSQHDPISATWEALGSSEESAFYRREDVYSMHWSVGDLGNYVTTAARFGGPLALMRDETKPTVVGKQQIGKPKISIYSSAGSLIQTIHPAQWDSPSKIVRFGFTLNESLVVLTQDGSYRLYPLSTTASTTTAGYTTHTLGTEAAETGVLDARIYETGMVALLGSLAFVELSNWNEADLSDPTAGGAPRITRLAEAELTEQPVCWDVVPPEESTSRIAEVHAVVRNTVLTIDAIECRDERFTRGPFTNLVASPNGRFLALTTGAEAAQPHQLWVVSSDFGRVLSEYELSNEADGTEPDQLVWCGSNTVILSWGGIVMMMAPFGETLRYLYTEPVHLVSEIDGTRIISSDRCELLQKVPDSSLAVFRPGSAAPAAILFDAAEQFERMTAKAEDSLRSIRADLSLAVDTCIDAAGREFDVYWQRRLLKAASFGKTFLDLYNPSDFVAMSQTLRVLNAARFHEVGIPITYEQLRRHGPARLLNRLTLRGHHLLSLRIASFLHLSTAPVLRHWASSKVAAAKGSENEEAVCRTIVERLEGQSDVSCADIAQTAWATGQVVLATKLLDHEPRASKQVPLLLTMKEDNLALVKAIDSGDPDLVYSVLARLRKTHSLGNFFRFVDKKPDAAALLSVSARQNDPDLLRDFLYQDDRRTDSACLSLEEALATRDFAEKMAKIRQASKAFSEDKERSFESRMIDEELKLLAFQQDLDKEGGERRSYVGLSVNDTIRQCIISGSSKRAEKLRADFRIPDRRFWLVKMKALIEVRDWEGLEIFARSKKSPVGYEPFVEHLVATGNHRQALSYVPRCEQRHRVDLYIKCGEWLRAAQECKERGDRGRLLELRQRCPNQMIMAQIDDMLHEMGAASWPT